MQEREWETKRNENRLDGRMTMDKNATNMEANVFPSTQLRNLPPMRPTDLRYSRRTDGGPILDSLSSVPRGAFPSDRIGTASSSSSSPPYQADASLCDERGVRLAKRRGLSGDGRCHSSQNCLGVWSQRQHGDRRSDDGMMGMVQSCIHSFPVMVCAWKQSMGERGRERSRKKIPGWDSPKEMRTPKENSKHCRYSY